MGLLGDATWPEVEQGLTARPTPAVPVGATEQHGPHLPISTDTDIAIALASNLVSAAVHVSVAPPLAYGASGEHQSFPGTLSISQTAVELVLVELGRSATPTSRGTRGDSGPQRRRHAHVQAANAELGH